MDDQRSSSSSSDRNVILSETGSDSPSLFQNWNPNPAPLKKRNNDELVLNRLDGFSLHAVRPESRTAGFNFNFCAPKGGRKSTADGRKSSCGDITRGECAQHGIAMGSLTLSVNHSDLVAESMGRKYVEYSLDVDTGFGHKWTVWYRYKDWEALDKDLLRFLSKGARGSENSTILDRPRILGIFPEKKMNKNSVEVRKHRMEMFHSYVNYLLNQPQVRSSRVFQRFICESPRMSVYASMSPAEVI